MIDEQARSGGQIYRRPPPEHSRDAATLYGTEAARAEALHTCFDALAERIDWRPETLVWNLWQMTLHTWHRQQGAARVAADAVILATGAMDRVVPFPGWTLPGVFTLGGAQVALKHQGCAVGRRTVFVGTGPLLYLVAAQYAKAGAAVAAVLDTAPAHRRITALPALLNDWPTAAKGLALVRSLKAAGVALHNNVVPLAAEGGDAVEAFRWRDRLGREHRVACDAVATGFWLKPESQLAERADVPFRYDADERQWLPVADVHGRAAAGVYLAGDGAGVMGADAAELRGALAAHALLADLGVRRDAAAMVELESALGQIRRFRRGLAHAFPLPDGLAASLPDDELVCRCEGITAGELRRAARELDAPEVNRAKAFCRVGMGRCQGRVCGLAAAEIVAAARHVPLARAGRLRGQAPVKPVPIGALAESEP